MNRQSMNAALRDRFVPSLRSRGFKGSLPHFRRVGEDRIDLLTVQFDKYGGGFVIEIGRCPVEGFTTYWGKKIPPAKVTASYLHANDRHRLGSPGRGKDGRWFRYDDGRTSVKTVANAAASMLPEADVWWNRESRGRKS